MYRIKLQTGRSENRYFNLKRFFYAQQIIYSFKMKCCNYVEVMMNSLYYMRDKLLEMNIKRKKKCGKVRIHP